MSQRVPIALLGLVLMLVPVATRAGGLDRGPGRRPVDIGPIALTPLKRAELDVLQVERWDPRETRAPRQPVTDLLIELLPGRGDLRRALSGESGTGVAAETRLFKARVMAVSGGRLHVGDPAWCGGFENGISICRLDCDGGRFALRGARDAAVRLDLLVGGTDNAADAGEAVGFALGACGADSADQLRLVPKSGRTSALVSLASE